MPIQIETVQVTPSDKIAWHASRYIAAHLRVEDLYEFCANGTHPDKIPVIVDQCARAGEAYVFHYKAEPVFIWGVTQSIPGVYHLWGFGTDQTRRAMPAITRWGMTTWLPDFLARTKARRIEVRVPVSSIHSIGWLRKLGMEIEARLPGYSVVGEDFFQLAFTTPKRDLEDVLSPSPRSPSSDQGAHEDSCRHSA